MYVEKSYLHLFLLLYNDENFEIHPFPWSGMLGLDKQFYVFILYYSFIFFFYKSFPSAKKFYPTLIVMTSVIAVTYHFHAKDRWD